MKFIALKPARIVTMFGSCVFMEEGEERELNGKLAEAAMAHPDVVAAESANALMEKIAAAKKAAAASEPAVEDEDEDEAEPAGDALAEAKKQEMKEAIVRLIAANNSDDFTAQGYPRVASVVGEMGREDINSQEIREAFDEIKAGV